MSKQLIASTKRKENKDLDTGNMEVSEDEEPTGVWPPFKRLYGTRSY